MAEMQDLMDALDGHQITNDEGQVAEETATEEVPSVEQTPVIESEEKPEQETAETNPEVAEDEEGKKYVPEGRFKEVYAQKKELEREIEKLRKAPTQRTESPSTGNINPDRASLLETELLHQTLPQFNPNSPEYSEVLDEMGAEIYSASFRFDPKTQTAMPTITKLEAGRRAMDRAKKLSGVQDKIRNEARIIKTQQSDSGLTSTSRKVVDKNPDDMSLEEKEEYLRKAGVWN